ncbi:MAG TPA: polysaccharide biosynthesis tyrosine autokinase [Verrucomicrobiae bacterium]|nr:polysaccharide biosynthesis tyrosine autokinase [Verrucomicrobiae bacterium]
MINQSGGSQNSGEHRSESVDIKEYIVVLLKRKWLVLICFLLSMAGTTAFLFTRQPIYQANAKMRVTNAGGSLPVSEVLREDESRFYATEIDILTGQTMLRRVQQRLRKTTEEIHENLFDLKVQVVRGSSILQVTVDSPSTDFAKDFANALCEEYLRYRDEQRSQSSESALLMLTREINRLGQELKGTQERYVEYAKEHDLPQMQGTEGVWWRSFYMNLADFASLKEQLARAKAVANALDKDNAAAAIALLDQSQQSQQYSAAHGISAETNLAGSVALPPGGLLAEADGTNSLGMLTGTGDGVEPAAKFPSDATTNADSLLASVGNLTLDARRNSGDASLAQSIASVAAATSDQVLVHTLVDLEQRRAGLEVKIQDLSRTLKGRHPAVVTAQQELDDVNQNIRFQMKLARDIQNARISSLEAQVQYAEKGLEDAKKEGMERSKSVLLGQTIHDDVERTRSLYNALLNQLMKIDASQGFNARTISVSEPAILEGEPVYPKKVRGLLIAAFLGLGFGLAIAFFFEYIDDSIKLAEEVERDLQLPFLGMIPAAQWNPDDLSVHRLDKLKQQGGVAESYRVVRSAIIFSTPREKLRSMLVTSAVPREGKTTTCVNLAIGFSQVEDRVLLIDADLRRGEIHKYFGFEKDKGLADILLGEATAEQVIKRGDVAKLDVITCGAYPANPAELLLGWRLKEFLDWAYKHYDRVVVDCPPVMGIADSAILGSAVDGVLFIIWAGRTSRRYVRVAKMTAVSRGAKVFGFVLNNLEPGRVGYYHYYPYYYSYYSRGYYYAHKEDEGKGGDIKGIEIPTQQDGKDQIDDVY